MDANPARADVRDGRHRNSSEPPRQRNETHHAARFYDIVDNERIDYVYDMHIRGGRHSLSLVTVEITPSGGETRLVCTEQTAWLDGTSAAEGVAPASAVKAGIWTI